MTPEVAMQFLGLGAALLCCSRGWLKQRPLTSLDCLLHRLEKQLRRDRHSRHLSRARTTSTPD